MVQNSLYSGISEVENTNAQGLADAILQLLTEVDIVNYNG